MIQTLQRRIPKRVFVNPKFKDRATVLKTSEETGGRYLLGLLEVSPGGGNPMHTHSLFEETFTAMEGNLGVQFGDQKIYLKPGESITVPPKQPHCFFNDSDSSVSCYVKLTPDPSGFVHGPDGHEAVRCIRMVHAPLPAAGKTGKKKWYRTTVIGEVLL